MVTITGLPTATVPVADAMPATDGPAVIAQPLNITEMIVVSSVNHGVDLNLALKIARCESHLRQYVDDRGTVLRGRKNSADVGVYQINERYHLSRSRNLGLDIYETGGNIEYAMALFKESGTRPWQASRKCWSQ